MSNGTGEKASGFTPSILLIDDEEGILEIMKMTLRAAGYSSILAFSKSKEALDLISSRGCDLVVLDIMMNEISGVEVLKRIKETDSDISVIMATGLNEVETAVQCMKAGALDYIVKPVEPERLLTSIANALKLRAMSREYRVLSERMLSNTLHNPRIFARIVTRNERMFNIFKYIEAIALTPHPVLITGETGTGKELIARAIHDASGRPGKFVAVNVSGLDDTMFSDTLFGHSKGAFTGAHGSRRGMIETASGGTLFLDEIGDLSIQSQVKLLRLLQEREYFPLGYDIPKQSNARIVTATRMELSILENSETFRRDLFFRLRTHHIHLPPLRERKEDLELLTEAILEKVASEQNKTKPTVSPELYTLLRTYHFPGNVRELEGMIRNAVSLHKERILSSISFREQIGNTVESKAGKSSSPSVPTKVIFQDQLPTLKEMERLLIQEAASRAQGNQSVAAALLGISRQSLSYHLKKADKF